ncbi:site-specific DNA-methyltransferase [Blastococcus sp. MG754426]|uniref:site-specific DNA-methyltransferase n=1 Tax=unclassified Blastococcus TaxID=2619396 RepID=UPI001EEF7A1E|nr:MULTISPECIES: site-specific DNA-methyltransferase [unclassified Blastococcus]MCF6507029.1 site-specific DNA-methyltransferase [Blastococcus sp. MG754426]MCF6511694.1 site-specific DNA-methyltransferase [Blastococcus sp. MG754427]
MRNPNGPKTPTPVEAIEHRDTRINLPTADAVEDFGTPELEAIRTVALDRDPSLDPQLIWKGKYPDGDPDAGTDLVVDAPPIYIQEKIDPRVLVENLRKTAAAGESEPELSLFESFDGLDELDMIEYYQHQANWSNRMVLGDSLQVMASLADREALRGQVQMIYIDPPYGIKFGSNWQVSARKRDVKDGKLQDAARESEQIKAFRDTWELGIHSYLSYLKDRLSCARELLTDSGSCFVQIGDENVHLVRSLMDEVFGSENFVTMVTVRKTHTAGSPSGGTDVLASVSDYILWYAKSLDRVKYRQLHEQRPGFDWVNYDYVLNRRGQSRRITKEEKLGTVPLAHGERVYRRSPLTSSSSPDSARFPVTHGGVHYTPGRGGWKTNAVGMSRLSMADRLEAYGKTLAFRRYTDDFPYFPRTNLWTDTARGGYGEEQWYVVQTGTKVIERCMLMCTDPGDLVLDPTCGSGTTAYVGEQWGRRWITIDTSRVALALARQRLMSAKFPYYFIADSVEGRAKEEQASGKPLPPAEVHGDIRHGFVFERVQRVTLKSIANNPDIREGMSGDEIDAAIKRHADFEVLYDKPYEDKSKVRVTGPFTVESLSPHRSLAFAGGPDDVEHRETISEQTAAADASAPTFEESILDNLAKAGIQNGRRKERIHFAGMEPYAGIYIQAIGQRAEGAEGEEAAPSRVGVAIGPQYGTVSPTFIKSAAREAIRAGDVDLLCVLGFAFDAQATEVTEADGVTVESTDQGFASVAGERTVGRIRVLLVRMNVDLLMGEDLAKTGAGNLFTVFGEPDIELRSTDGGQVVVDLKGVDVFDPTTGEIRSDDTSQIALWMIDTNYNEESFFVRHCYFTGGNDPYKRLKAALKAEIEPDAWESLYRTESRPFDKPETGRIAVKVINDYGDEVMKVFEV